MPQCSSVVAEAQQPEAQPAASPAHKYLHSMPFEGCHAPHSLLGSGPCWGCPLTVCSAWLLSALHRTTLPDQTRLHRSHSDAPWRPHSSGLSLVALRRAPGRSCCQRCTCCSCSSWPMAPAQGPPSSLCLSSMWLPCARLWTWARSTACGCDRRYAAVVQLRCTWLLCAWRPAACGRRSAQLWLEQLQVCNLQLRIETRAAAVVSRKLNTCRNPSLAQLLEHAPSDSWLWLAALTADCAVQEEARMKGNQPALTELISLCQARHAMRALPDCSCSCCMLSHCTGLAAVWASCLQSSGC